MLIIFTIGTLLNYRAKSYKHDKLKALNDLQLAKESLLTNAQTISEMSRSAEDIFLSRFRDYDNLLTMLYESDKPEIVSNRVNKGLRNLKRQLKENSDELLSLESYVNSCRNNLINDFRNSYPQCTNRALTFFLYKCLGLSDKSITVVTDNKITNIYNWKYRLKNMISQSDIPTANKDRFIKELCR